VGTESSSLCLICDIILMFAAQSKEI